MRQKKQENLNKWNDILKDILQMTWKTGRSRFREGSISANHTKEHSQFCSPDFYYIWKHLKVTQFLIG